MAGLFYVYAYSEPTTGTPFYIGKGRGNRLHQHRYPSNLKHRTHFYNKLRRLLAKGVTPAIHKIVDNLTETESHHYEQFFIAALGRRNSTDNPGPLCNLTDGGEGFTGYVFTEKRRQQAAESARRTKNNLGHKHSDETKAVIREKRKQQICSDETRQKMSRSLRGKKRTLEQRLRLSEACKGRKCTDETRQKISQANTGRKRTDEVKQKMSNFHKRRWQIKKEKSGG